MSAHECIGLLAGGGSLPREIAERIAASGRAVQIVAIRGEADADFTSFPHSYVSWGQIGHMFDAFHKAECRELLIIGRVRRPDLRRLKLDLGFFLSLPGIIKMLRSAGDDDVLRRVIRFFEAKGFRVVGPLTVAPDLALGEGAFGRFSPDEGQLEDIALGFAVVRALGAFDIGQAAVVAGGRLLAIEGAEGTDAMLWRVATLRRRSAADSLAPSGVLIKGPKPQQDMRVDVPAVGPETIDRAAAAGLAGIAVAAGRVLAAERDRVRAQADAAGLFIAGMDATPREAVISPAVAPKLHRIGQIRLDESAANDALKAAAIAAMLQSLNAGRAVAVVRGHVLAVAAAEGAEMTVERLKTLRQWGRRKRRAGAVVLAPGVLPSVALITHAAEAGLAGVAVMGTSAPSAETITAANTHGIALACVAAASESP